MLLSVSDYPSTYLSIYLSTYLSIYLSILFTVSFLDAHKYPNQCLPSFKNRIVCVISLSFFHGLALIFVYFP